jgi:hypothetical protein
MKAKGKRLVSSGPEGEVSRRKAKKVLATKGEGKLLDLFEQLTSEQQDKLIAFAEFLTVGAQEGPVAAEPVAIPRPAAETVTMAIRRLTKSYPMLDRRRLMGEASQLLAQHALQGRPSAAVIDDLEVLFSRQFEQHKAKGRRSVSSGPEGEVNRRKAKG